MATIPEIQVYVKTTHGFSPKSCWIADVKESCGISVQPSHNRLSPDKRSNPCPPNKKDAIVDALKYFKMI